MGCWNGTCGLSNLPIEAGDKILLFVLAQTRIQDEMGGGFCYSTDRYAPVGVPIYGAYNDYGGIENVTRNGDEMFDFLTTDRRFKWIPNDDVTIVPTDIEELINDVISREECANYSFMMIREDILDGLKAQNVSEYATYAPQFAEFNAAYNTEIEIVKTEEGESYNPALHYRHAEMELQDKLGYRNRFANLLERHEFSSLKPMLRNVPVEPSETMQQGIIDVLYVNSVLSDLRKFWTAQSGAGSQDSEHNVHLALCHTMISVCAKREIEDQNDW